EAERDGERLQGGHAEELRAARARAEQSQKPGLAAVRTADVDPLAGADVRGADPVHLAVVARSAEGAVLWVRSNETHAVWCERIGGGREVIRVARGEGGGVGGQDTVGWGGGGGVTGARAQAH